MYGFSLHKQPVIQFESLSSNYSNRRNRQTAHIITASYTKLNIQKYYSSLNVITNNLCGVFIQEGKKWVPDFLCLPSSTALSFPVNMLHLSACRGFLINIAFKHKKIITRARLKNVNVWAPRVVLK